MIEGVYGAPLHGSVQKREWRPLTEKEKDISGELISTAVSQMAKGGGVTVKPLLTAILPMSVILF